MDRTVFGLDVSALDWQRLTCGQSYKASTSVNYNSRVINISQFLVIYKRKMLRLSTVVFSHNVEVAFFARIESSSVKLSEVRLCVAFGSEQKNGFLARSLVRKYFKAYLRSLSRHLTFQSWPLYKLLCSSISSSSRPQHILTHTERANYKYRLIFRLFTDPSTA